MHRWRSRAYAVMVVGLMIAGCASTRAPILPDGPVAWQEGYTHGYNSLLAIRVPKAKVASTGEGLSYRKDLERFETDKLYADGWQMGYAAADAMVNRAEAERRHQQTLIGILMW